MGFDIGTCAYDDLIHELKTGVSDLAFLLAESIPFSDLAAELLAIEPLALVSSPDHPLAGQPDMQLQDLNGRTILVPKHDCGYKMVFERILTEEKVAPDAFIALNSIEALKQCVLKGIGVAMIPMMAVRQEIKQKKLIPLKWPEDKLETGILMIRHKHKWISPTLQVFMDTVRDVVNNGYSDE